MYPYGSDDTCGWLPGTDDTVCSGTPCVIAWERDQRKKKAERKPLSRFQELIKTGYGYGAAQMQVRREDRNARRRRRRKRAA